MPFSFRNLFPDNSGAPKGGAPQSFGSDLPGQRGNFQDGLPGANGQYAAGDGERQSPLFAQAQPTDRGSFEQMFSGAGGRSAVVPAPAWAASGADPSDGRQAAAYAAGELLQFIPRALASPDAVPMEIPVSVLLPADGSRDVKLSDLYLGCPQLFATEITPLNDSQVTLPFPRQAPVGHDTGPSPFGAAALSAQNIPAAVPAWGGAAQNGLTHGYGSNPFDPGVVNAGFPIAGLEPGYLPQALSPAPLAWQQEHYQQPQPHSSEQAWQVLQPTVAATAPIVAPTMEFELAPALSPSPEPEWAASSGAPPHSSLEGFPGTGMAPLPVSIKHFSGAQDESTAAPVENPGYGAPHARAEVFQQPEGLDWSGGSGGGDSDGGGSPFDLDDENPFFLAEDEDDEDEGDDWTKNAVAGGAFEVVRGDEHPTEVDAGSWQSALAETTADAGFSEFGDAPQFLPGAVQKMGALEPSEDLNSATAPVSTLAPTGWPAGLFGDLAPSVNASDAVSAEAAQPPMATPVAAPERAPEPATLATLATLATSFAAAVPVPEVSVVAEQPAISSFPTVEPPVQPTPTMAAAATTAVAKADPATLDFSLRELLAPFSAEELGFSPDSLPADLVARLPLSRIDPQVASGRVAVYLGDLAVAVDEPHGHILAQGNQGLEIVISPDSLFHRLEQRVDWAAATEAEEFTAEVAATTSWGLDLPRVGAAEGFSTQFSQLAEEDRDLPAPQSRFAAKPIDSDSASRDAGVGTCRKTRVPFDSHESPTVPENGLPYSTPPPLPPLTAWEKSGNIDPAATAEEVPTAPEAEPASDEEMEMEDDARRAETSSQWSQWGGAIPGPLRKPGVDPKTDLDPEVEVEAEMVAGRKPQTLAAGIKIEAPSKMTSAKPASRSIRISVGPGAVASGDVQKNPKLSVDRKSEEASPSPEDPPSDWQSVEETKSKMQPTAADRYFSGNAAPGVVQDRWADDGDAALDADSEDDEAPSVFTPSRPDNDPSASTKPWHAVKRNSLDRLPVYEGAGSDAEHGREGVGAEDGGYGQPPAGDFFAELEPPPFSFQKPVETPPPAHEDSATATETLAQPIVETRDDAPAKSAAPVAGGDGARDVGAGSGFASGGVAGVDEFRDLELRAIFGSTEEFTLKRVAELTLDLCSTIDSCALSTRGRAINVSRHHGQEDSEEAQRRERKAQAMHRSVREAADNAGFTRAQTLILHTDRETISFFQRGDVCLTVHHCRSGFPDGVREKLMLVTYGVAAMDDRRQGI